MKNDAASDLARGLKALEDKVFPPGLRMMMRIHNNLRNVTTLQDKVVSQSRMMAQFHDNMRSPSFDAATALMLNVGPRSAAFQAGVADHRAFGRYGLAMEADPARALHDAVPKDAMHQAMAGDAVHAATAAYELQRRLQATMSWSAVKNLANSVGMAASATHQLDRIAKFDRALRQALPLKLHEPWSAHLKATAPTVLSLLGREWAKPMGVLAALPDASRGASISWLSRHRGAPLVMTAAILPELEEPSADDAPAQAHFTLEDGDPICLLCREPFPWFGATLRLKGPSRMIRHRLFLPLCPGCWEREREEPGYLARELAKRTRPRSTYRVILGGGQGDGKPRGSLRRIHLVRDDEDQAE